MDGTNTAHPANCKGCGCEIETTIRGLCRRCYQILRAAVAAKKTTWAKAEASGACLPRGAVAQGRPAKFAELFPQLADKTPSKASKAK